MAMPEAAAIPPENVTTAGALAAEVSETSRRVLRFSQTLMVATLGDAILRFPASFQAPENVERAATGLGVIAAGVFFCARPQAALAAGLVTVALLVDVVRAFPDIVSHHLLALCSLLVASSLRLGIPAEREVRATHATLRAMAAAALFWSGASKLFFGHHWQGQFLAASVVVQEKFRRGFRIVVPTDEAARILALGTPWEGFLGPYTVGFGVALAAMWLIPFLEIGAACALLTAKGRRLGLIVAVTALILTQVLTPELAFGLMVASHLALFLPTSQVNRGPLLTAVAYGLAITANLLLSFVAPRQVLF
jgi:hypothetical protein